ncbi:MAG: family 78 glycoside hydrolase catalytic domain [Phycisphaerae bacterium]
MKVTTKSSVTVSRRDVIKTAAMAIVGGNAVRADARNTQHQNDAPTNLTCEYLVDPLGVDVRHPRLSWMLGSSQRGERQTGYQILVARDAALLQPGKADVWDSGYCKSDQNVLVPYGGPALIAAGRYFWTLRTWNAQHTASSWAAPARWEMGMLNPTDWQPAQWIELAKDTRNSPLVFRPWQTSTMKAPSQKKAFASPLFRKAFSISKPIARARMYICGLGYHELYVNGARIGTQQLDPGMTTYDARAFYVVHDLTQALRTGDNAIGVMLGNGFFGQNIVWGPWLAWGEPVLLAKCIVEYANGSVQTIATDSTWRATTGPVLFDNVYAGETYDARLEIPDWNQPGLDDSHWQSARIRKAPTLQLQSQMIQSIQDTHTIKPKRIIASSGGKWIVDLGQNFAGCVRLTLNEPAGTQITLRMAEILAPGGTEIDPSTTGVYATGVVQTEIYVCKGGGEQWRPRFTYHGFRFVEVAGLKRKPAPSFMQGIQLRTAAEKRGDFVCSDPLLNRIYRTSLWTLASNMHSITEDCPQREKCAWMGDMEIYGQAAIYNYHLAPLFNKLADDMDTTLGRGGITPWQKPASPGLPCNIAAGRRLCDQANPDWGAALVALPWFIYLYYGDASTLGRQYPHMKRWVRYVASAEVSKNGIVQYGFGDWCPPGIGGANPKCPVPLTSTALQYASLTIMTKTAAMLGHSDDEKWFRRQAAIVKAAFHKTFYQPHTNGYGSQTANAVALRFDLVPDKHKSAVAAALADEIKAQHNHADTGILGSRPLYTLLNDHGYDELTYRMMKKIDYPSYGYMLSRGDTTWPEVQYNTPLNQPQINCSYNHGMQSGFAAWFHESIAGIRPLEASPGFKQIVMRPHNFRQLTSVSAYHQSMYGTIKSEWRRKGSHFHWNIALPPNTTAQVAIPARDLNLVREGAKAINAQRPHIRFLKWEGNHAIFAVASGAYKFSSVLTDI